VPSAVRYLGGGPPPVAPASLRPVPRPAGGNPPGRALVRGAGARRKPWTSGSSTAPS